MRREYSRAAPFCAKSPELLQVLYKRTCSATRMLLPPPADPARRRGNKERRMKHPFDTLPVRLQSGGICIQSTDWSDLNVARIRFPAGADAAPLLRGLPQDLCQCPHWGTVVRGSIRVRFADGHEELVHAGEVYYWPPGHTVRVDEDYEAIEFSPAGPMHDVVSHLKSQLEN
jgi:hypothetical protein